MSPKNEISRENGDSAPSFRFRRFLTLRFTKKNKKNKLKKGNGVTFFHRRRKCESMTSHKFFGFSPNPPTTPPKKRADLPPLLARSNLAVIRHFNSAASEAALFKLPNEFKERIVLASLRPRPGCGKDQNLIRPAIGQSDFSFSQCQAKLDRNCLPEISAEISGSDQASQDYARAHIRTCRGSAALSG